MLCKPKPFYDEKKKVGIGYKNPLYLTKAKQVQPALYNGHELVKTTHAHAVVHESEDTLKIAEKTRIGMLEKMKSTLWVDSKIKIAHIDYSKENYLATFTPHRQLTPEQIFWSLKIEDLTLKPMSKMTIITPCGLTEGERGFEQTKECYLTEVILFFNKLKEHFEGIQTALVKEVKEMKENFEQMEVEVEQNAVDKQCADIERKNLLIQSKNLITNWLSNEVLYSVMNDGNIVSKFSGMHDAYTVEQARCLELEAELSKLKHKIQKDDHMLAPGMYAIDVEPIHPRNRNNREVHLDYLKHLKESVETLREIVEEARIEKPLDNAFENACFYTKRSQELLEYVIGTCLKEFNKRDKSSTEASGSKPRRNTKNTRILTPRSDNKKKVKDHPRNNKSNLKQKNRVDSSISFKRTVINSNSNSVCKTCNKCLIYANHDKCVVKYLTSVNAPPFVKDVLSTFKQVWKEIGKLFVNVGYQWKPTGRKFTLGEQCPLTRFTKSKVASLQQPKHVSSSEIVITEKLNNTSLKLLTRDKRRNKQTKATSTSIPITAETQPIDASGNILLFLLTNRTPTKIGAPNYQTLHLYLFSNSGRTYRPLVFGLRLLKTYDEESLSAQEFHEKVHRDRKFYDLDLEVAFRKHLCYVRNEDSVELLKGSRGSNMYTISVEDMMKSSPIFFLSKASKNKSWLWHRQLNHLNFSTINDLA
ncbi:hypothetical protein Tco_1097811 [Tanacetum coccineum]